MATKIKRHSNTNTFSRFLCGFDSRTGHQKMVCCKMKVLQQALFLSQGSLSLRNFP